MNTRADSRHRRTRGLSLVLSIMVLGSFAASSLAVPIKIGTTRGDYFKAADTTNRARTWGTPPTMFGAELVGGLKKTAGPDRFDLRWLQVIDTTDPLGGPGNPYIDPRPNPDLEPFYWDTGQFDTPPAGNYWYQTYQNRAGFLYQFVDYPRRARNAVRDVTWSADLWLGVWGAKKYTIYGLATWGFRIKKGGGGIGGADRELDEPDGYADPNDVELYEMYVAASYEDPQAFSNDPIVLGAFDRLLDTAATDGFSDWDISLIPEPASLVLLAFGSLVALRRRLGGVS
jgi:hypothetical protein